MIIIAFFLFILHLFLATNQAWGEYMICYKGNVYEGDSQAQVLKRCGPPIEQYRSDPIKVEDNLGGRKITRVHHQYMYVYPGSGGYVYYLKFENHKLISIDLGRPDEIPK